MGLGALHRFLPDFLFLEVKLRKTKETGEDGMSERSANDQVIDKLRSDGCRITNQRRILIDVILGNDCASCKEIYYLASKKDPSIGIATVYRMMRTLEEHGIISRKSMYKIEI